MKILVTGAKGFIGKNLVAELENRSAGEILEYDLDTDASMLEKFCSQAGFVFHLAGVNRPEEDSEFMKGNRDFTAHLLSILERRGNTSPVMFASSSQAALDNPYGRSKKAGEDLVFEHAGQTGARALVYRFPNVFGKWCRPSYNSVVATFCHNIANGLPIVVNDRDTLVNLAYIDDVVAELINALYGRENTDPPFCRVEEVYEARLGEIADTIISFKELRGHLGLPDMSDPFASKLYSTYLSYLPEDGFSYPLKMNSDERGSFTEFVRTADRGQFSVNVSRPGVLKGNHWHHSKNEKFLVVSGSGVIRFRAVGSDRVVEYPVSGERLEVVEIPPGYTHNIENTGESEMVTLMWASELFNPERPDTYFLEV